MDDFIYTPLIVVGTTFILLALYKLKQWRGYKVAHVIGGILIGSGSAMVGLFLKVYLPLTFPGVIETGYWLVTIISALVGGAIVGLISSVISLNIGQDTLKWQILNVILGLLVSILLKWGGSLT